MKLRIKEEYKGLDVWTIQPPYKRDEEKFTLDDKLSQKDMKYLKEVIGLDYFEDDGNRIQE